MSQKEVDIIIDLTTAATTTAYWDMNHSDLMAIQVEHGSITGTFLVKERIGSLKGIAGATTEKMTYKTNTNISLTAPADSISAEVVPFCDVAPNHYSITYTHTSGTSYLRVGVITYNRSR